MALQPAYPLKALLQHLRELFCTDCPIRGQQPPLIKPQCMHGIIFLFHSATLRIVSALSESLVTFRRR